MEEGNIKADPAFVDPANFDYHLKSQRGFRGYSDFSIHNMSPRGVLKSEYRPSSPGAVIPGSPALSDLPAVVYVRCHAMLGS